VKFLPSKPEDFSKVEHKFKLSLLQLQKRMTDLEVAISELKESVETGAGKSGDVAELGQRVEDVEDLIMVEQAGIMELQKMMQQAQEHFQSLGAEVPEETEKRIETLESDIDTLKTDRQQTIDLSPFKNQLGMVQDDVEELKRIVEAGAGAKIDFITSRLDNINARLGEYANKNVETDLKVEGLEKSLAVVENRMAGATPAGINEKLENNKKDMTMISAKLESAESVIRNLSVQVNELDSQLKKIGSFEKMSLLSKQVEDKIERFKFIEDELRRLSSRMEMLYSSIDQRMEKLNSFDAEMKKNTKNVLALADEVDKNRVGLLAAVKKDELSDALNRRTEELNKKMDANISNMTAELESTKQKLKKFSDALAEGNIQAKLSEIESKLRMVEDTNMRAVEDLSRMLDSKIAEVHEPTAVFETQMGELLNRMVFLESRLAAIESKMQKLISVQPIVLE